MPEPVKNKGGNSLYRFQQIIKNTPIQRLQQFLPKKQNLVLLPAANDVALSENMALESLTGALN
ncbi:hypothetical protein [Undibacterium pigrum]|uniref:hypothetical protein n=1 Tax=Undibacterium pigrum TaxID=401470 RepID=UPI000D765651|nr:hypothetical protein [Undibacterium pigrum]